MVSTYSDNLKISTYLQLPCFAAVVSGDENMKLLKFLQKTQ